MVKPPGQESALQEVVAKQGPVSVAIDAESDFRYYHSGGAPPVFSIYFAVLL